MFLALSSFLILMFLYFSFSRVVPFTKVLGGQFYVVMFLGKGILVIWYHMI